MVSWSDMPVVFDRPMWCEKCRATTVHSVKAYKDEEIRTCTRCHTRTIYEVVDSKLEEAERRTPDPTKDESDFKRNAKRKYKPRKKKGGDED